MAKNIPPKHLTMARTREEVAMSCEVTFEKKEIEANIKGMKIVLGISGDSGMKSVDIGQKDKNQGEWIEVSTMWKLKDTKNRCDQHVKKSNNL